MDYYSDMRENKGKGKLDHISNNAFFTFSKPYLDFISNGKIFDTIYLVIAVINLMLPFAFIFATVKLGIFDRLGILGTDVVKYLFAIILAWMVIAFAGWIGFQLWWDRRSRVAHIASAEFIATPIFSDLLQTSGEWLGTMIGILGAGVGLIALIFLGKEANDLFRLLQMDWFMRFGSMVIIIGPVVGFLIIIVSRFAAEQLQLVVALANNTKEIATNLKNHDKVTGGIEAARTPMVNPPDPFKKILKPTITYIVKEKIKLYEHRGDYTNIVCILNPYETVTYLETGSTVSVRNIPAPMFYVKTSTGKLGWCFSGLLEKREYGN
jgi:hypothetical protein